MRAHAFSGDEVHDRGPWRTPWTSQDTHTKWWVSGNSASRAQKTVALHPTKHMPIAKPVHLHVGDAEVDLYQSRCAIVCVTFFVAIQGLERRQRPSLDHLVHVQV